MKILTVMLVLISIVPSFVQGQSNFSEFQLFKHESLVDAYENDAYVPLMDMNQAKQDLAQLTRSYDDLVKTVDVLDKRKGSLSRHYNSASVSANATIQDMKKTQEILSKRQTQVSLSLNRVRDLEVSLGVLSEDILSGKKQLGVYSKFLYKTIHDYYLSDDEISILKLLTKSDSVAHSLGKQEISAMLFRHLELTFQEMDRITSLHQQTLHELQSTIAGYHQDIFLYEQDLEKLEQQRVHVEQLLGFLEKDKAFIDTQLSGFEASQKDLQSQIDRMDDITSKTEEFLAKNKEVDAILRESDKQDGSAYFSRPLRIPGGLNTSVKETVYSDAKGLVFQAKQGEEVYSPAPGIVYKVHVSEDVGLQWVILLHKYGYSTVILPLSEVFVKQGEVVRRGDMIGRVGGKPGTIGAGLESIEEHLYFEVLKNSDPLDPFLVMDISVYASIALLDEAYHLKRKQDYLSRNIDLSDLPVLKGETLEERRDYFLSKSGNSIFGDPGLRMEAAKGTGIDPIFGICIGAAETSYRNFKSGNNIGNVGNNDRGDTVIYDSPLAGVRAIYTTLGNKYLGEYTMMNQLSRYGNKTGSIYASDPINWQKNIMRCLSMMYEVNVPEEYFFRIKE